MKVDKSELTFLNQLTSEVIILNKDMYIVWLNDSALNKGWFLNADKDKQGAAVGLAMVAPGIGFALGPLLSGFLYSSSMNLPFIFILPLFLLIIVLKLFSLFLYSLFEKGSLAFSPFFKVKKSGLSIKINLIL